MSILEDYLKKIGVKYFYELTEEEKATYRTWDETLSGRRLTDDDVFHFLEVELEETIQKLIPQRLEKREDLFLKMKLDFIRKVIQFLKTPETTKKLLEANINNLVQN